MKDYLLDKPNPLLGAETIQLVVLRELLDYTVLRTEDTREVNSVYTPLSATDRTSVKRVAFLGSKQKAAESRSLESLLRSACQAEQFEVTECYLKDNLCLQCPRCGLYGATALSNEPNIRHRIEYSTAFSLLTYDLLTEAITFNAVDEVNQMTGRALGTRHVVRPASLFPSIVTLKCVTWHELVLAVKTLLSTKSYGAETRIGGDCRNSIIGAVAAWEEIITPLELVLELYEMGDSFDAKGLARKLENDYKARAGNPQKVRVLTPEDTDAMVSECTAVKLDREFLKKVYTDIKEYRAMQAGA